MLPGLPPPTADVADAWARLDALLAARLPALAADLAPGAAPAALDALGGRTGLALPETLRALYAGHDGQRGAAPGLFFGLRFLPAADAGDEWDRWASLLRDDPTLAATIAVTASPAGAVRAVYADPGWLPIATDGAGNGLAVDLAPGPAGTPGQVISFGADEPVRRVLAPSALHLARWCADALASGRATVEDRPEAPGGQGFRIGAATNLLDALPALVG